MMDNMDTLGLFCELRFRVSVLFGLESAKCGTWGWQLDLVWFFSDPGKQHVFVVNQTHSSICLRVFVNYAPLLILKGMCHHWTFSPGASANGGISWVSGLAMSFLAQGFVTWQVWSTNATHWRRPRRSLPKPWRAFESVGGCPHDVLFTYHLLYLVAPSHPLSFSDLFSV